MAVTEELDFDLTLEPEVQTDKAKTKELPCRVCKRRCVVNRFKDARRTVCSVCRAQEEGDTQVSYEFDDSLETEVLTDKEQTKEVPCRKCHRRCVVTLFKTAATTTCNTCRGHKKEVRRQEVAQSKAHAVDPAKLENLLDGLINPAFRQIPLCPFDPGHTVELKCVTHTPYYGPRHLEGYDGKGIPHYRQETGESVVYQCNECYAVISYSTMHPLNLRAQNEPRATGSIGPSTLALRLGTRDDLP